MRQGAEPDSKLESSLEALVRGEITKEDFLRIFLVSNLYMMVDGEPEGEVLGNRKPMVIAADNNSPHLMAVFSSPDKAGKMVELFSDYSFPILVTCEWVLKHLGPHLGLTFNPGCAYGFEIAPGGAQQLKQALNQARSQLVE